MSQRTRVFTSTKNSSLLLWPVSLGAARRLRDLGYNQWGELGLGDRESRGDQAGEMGDELPFVDVDTGIASMALGDWHT